MPPLPSLRFVVLALAVALAGCTEEEFPASGADAVDAPAADAAVVAEPRAVKPSPPGAGIQPVAVASDAIAVGSALTDGGAVQSPKPAYAGSDTVYVSVPTSGHAPGETIRAYWSNASGMTDKQESKVVVAGESHANFAFSGEDGMVPGTYTVQVDIGDVPVGIVDFNVE